MADQTFETHKEQISSNLELLNHEVSTFKDRLQYLSNVITMQATEEAKNTCNNECCTMTVTSFRLQNEVENLRNQFNELTDPELHTDDAIHLLSASNDLQTEVAEFSNKLTQYTHAMSLWTASDKNLRHIITNCTP